MWCEGCRSHELGWVKGCTVPLKSIWLLLLPDFFSERVTLYLDQCGVMNMAKQMKIPRLSPRLFIKIQRGCQILWQDSPTEQLKAEEQPMAPHPKTACNQHNWMCSWLPQIHHGASGSAFGLWPCGRGELPLKKDVCQLLSVFCIQNHNRPVACGNKKRRNAGIWPVEDVYVPFEKGPVFAKTVAFVWRFSQTARQAAFLKLPVWPKQVVSGFLL